MTAEQSKTSTFGERLKAARKAAGLSQKQLASKVRMSQSNLSDMERDKAAGSSFTPKLAHILKVRAFWLAEGRGPRTTDEPVDEGSFANDLSIEVLDVAASMGTGELRADTENVVHKLSIGLDWVRENLRGISSTANLRVISGRGTSMEPTYSDGAILVVDIGDKTVRDNQVYVLSAGDRIFVKRVHQRVDGRFDITSDNPTAKGVETLNGEHQVTVHGRVVWAWDGKRL